MYIVMKRALLYLTELVTFTPLIKGEDHRTNRKKAKIVPIFLRRKCETTGNQSLSRPDLRESQRSSFNEKEPVQSCCGVFTSERHFANGMHRVQLDLVYPEKVNVTTLG